MVFQVSFCNFVPCGKERMPPGNFTLLQLSQPTVSCMSVAHTDDIKAGTMFGAADRLDQPTTIKHANYHAVHGEHT